ncbi:MAG: RagB/SusD family nutrient uptake outer membrane protein [Pedobacter sp.]|nr:RagB/SusD family nutrient uptake outer membrane protein [Pedobacter sp.]
MQPPNRDFEDFYLPKSRNNCDGSSNPTQNVVDAFPMMDGRPISESSALYPYNPQDPYSNRDPRFKYSIIYNTATWFSTTTDSEIPVFTYVGAQTDGFYQDPGAAGASGYLSRKMLAEGLTANFGTTDRNWPLIRYAEILLIKAEVLNKLNRTSEEYATIGEIFKLAGIIVGADGNYGTQAGMTRKNMRSFIQNERRIQLFNEDKRWDDVRRWKLATTLFDNK